MATEQNIKDIIFDWAIVASSLAEDNIIWANQPEKGQSLVAPQPVGTYAVLEIISGPNRVGLVDEQRFPLASSPSEEMSYAGQRLLTLNVQIFGSSAYDYIVAVQNSLQTEEGRALLKKRQTATVSVNTPVVQDQEFILSIVGVSFTVVAGSSDDEEDIRDALLAAVNASEDIGRVEASEGATIADLDLQGAIGKDYSLTVNSNLSLSDQVNAVDLAVVGDEGITDVAELLETAWEPRKSMDVILRSHTDITQDIDYVENVEIEGTVGDIDSLITAEAGVLNYYLTVEEAIADDLDFYLAMQESSGVETTAVDKIAGNNMSMFTDVTIDSDTIGDLTKYKRIFGTEGYGEVSKSFLFDSQDWTIWMQGKESMGNSIAVPIVAFGEDELVLTRQIKAFGLIAHSGNVGTWSSAFPFSDIKNIVVTLDQATSDIVAYEVTRLNAIVRINTPASANYPANVSLMRFGRGIGSGTWSDSRYWIATGGFTPGQVRSFAIWKRILSTSEMTIIADKLDIQGALIV